MALLIATALSGLGITKKGATALAATSASTIQPSEIMKIAMPLMLAWWFQRREGQLRALDFLIAALLLLVPVGLIVKQPDLGTAILVLSAGIYVIFFAGLPWRLIIPVLLIGAAADHRVIVLGGADLPAGRQVAAAARLPEEPRLHAARPDARTRSARASTSSRAMIAIGSGGMTGKGFMKGTQTHLEFIPERTTDFIFAAFAEEFGLAGCVGLLLGFLFLIFRGLMIAAEAPTRVHAPARRRHHAQLLHLRLRQHGHGERHPAGGRRAAALHQLRRHGDGDARPRASAS